MGCLTRLAIIAGAGVPSTLVDLLEGAERGLVVGIHLAVDRRRSIVGAKPWLAGEIGLTIGAVLEIRVAVDRVEQDEQLLDAILDEAAQETKRGGLGGGGGRKAGAARRREPRHGRSA